MLHCSDKIYDDVIDIVGETQRFFGAAIGSKSPSPKLALIMGGTAAGKTRYRRANYGPEYIVLDAADIFISLSRGQYFDFPSILEEPMDIIGASVARRAVRERRNIVTEIIGHEYDPVKSLIDAMCRANYSVGVVHLEKDIVEAWKWNLARSDTNISALYTEPYHPRWLLGAVAENCAPNPAA
jgi:hypothetical protein